MFMFDKSKWIWKEDGFLPDEYVEFYFEFNSGKKTFLNISVDSDYAFYINGELVSFGQYPDFPHYKIYDSVDITNYCKIGKNKCGLVVYYKGDTTCQTYFPSDAGLLFEIISDGAVVAFSGEAVVSRLSPSYLNHRCKKITGQLGYTFHYSLDKADDWLLGEVDGFSESVSVDKKVKLYPRPCKKTELLERVDYNIVLNEDNKRYIIDLKKEQVGFIDIQLESNTDQFLLISYGEHLADGSVRRLISGRDFSVSFDIKKGINRYMNPFLRLGCRYLELFFENPTNISYVGLRPVVYPLEVKENPFSDKRKQIYDACVHTLRCCMHDHYEDCPWREQALYTMDSRNQMLCGYYAFSEFEFARASLKLVAESICENGFLPICHPCAADLVIPSFNLHYFTQSREYVDYSKDFGFIKENYHVFETLINTFISHMKGNLIPAISGKNMWNFYEWTDGLTGNIADTDLKNTDLCLNCLFVSALRNMSYFAKIAEKEDIYSPIAEKVIVGINDVFYNKEKKLYKNNDIDEMYSQLGNSLAILCGAATGDVASNLADRIVNDSSLTKSSLSMEAFIYDALLAVNKEKYKDYILNQLDMEYGFMLENGATTFWETLDGEKAFGLAGSLCHGWSALPIYYYSILI